jgi:hypothetical protein
MNAVRWTRKSGEEAAGRALHAGGAAVPELALPPQAHNAITGRITINAAQRFALDLSKFTLSDRAIINTTGLVTSPFVSAIPALFAIHVCRGIPVQTEFVQYAFEDKSMSTLIAVFESRSQQLSFSWV